MRHKPAEPIPRYRPGPIYAGPSPDHHRGGGQAVDPGTPSNSPYAVPAPEPFAVAYWRHGMVYTEEFESLLAAERFVESVEDDGTASCVAITDLDEVVWESGPSAFAAWCAAVARITYR